ncbi:hypothetical protein F5882DRAFT_479888 [Hyaloscypha sp. PMI_1271]|nr:hypothetical protein F5882DRAFT_479888 [Hyaloscypha sp. PMI_1271]
MDISLLLKALDSNDSASSSPTHKHHTRSTSVPSREQVAELPSYALSSSGAGGKRSMPAHLAESPTKKQSKWSAGEDSLIIELRGGGMTWEEISKRLLGRSAISCRLHYKNYLERRSEWDREKKNKLAKLYTNKLTRWFKFNPEMWSKVAEEMAQLGEADMARRAGVVPFSLSSMIVDAPPGSHRSSPTRGHSHSRSQSSAMSGHSSTGPRFSRPAARRAAKGADDCGLERQYSNICCASMSE